jgi:hypothetical protein
VDPVPDPLLLRKSGSAGNRTQDLWVSSEEVTNINWKSFFPGSGPSDRQHEVTLKRSRDLQNVL